MEKTGGAEHAAEERQPCYCQQAVGETGRWAYKGEEPQPLHSDAATEANKMSCTMEFGHKLSTTVEQSEVEAASSCSTKKGTISTSATSSGLVRRSIAEPSEVARRHSDGDSRDKSRRNLDQEFGMAAESNTAVMEEELIPDPRQQPLELPPWMAYLEQKMSASHDRVESLIGRRMGKIRKDS